MADDSMRERPPEYRSTPGRERTPSRGPVPDPGKRPAYESAARLLTPTGYDPGMPRPMSTVAGAALVLLRVLAGIAWTISATGYVAEWVDDFGRLLGGTNEEASSMLTGGVTLFIVTNAVILLIQTLLAILIFAGRNWPRVIVMVLAAISIAISFTGWWAGGLEIHITGTFLSLGLDILILLALSSRSAAAYARRYERR